jgi:uncharacterized protein YdhG (YjbR/CyaY superfamily)
MANTDFKSVDDYIASQPHGSHKVLERVRGAIRRALPAADEVISYQIPAYKLHGNVVIYFAGWKEHYSLYPATGAMLAAFKDELTPRQIKNATVRFSLAEPVPVKLIERIAKFKAKEAGECAKAKTSRKRLPS